MSDPLTFTAVLDDATLKRIADIAGDQANRMNGMHMDVIELYHEIEYLMGLKNADGEPLHRIVGRWYDELSDEELRP